MEMFRKTLLVSIIFMIFAFSMGEHSSEHSELVVSRNTDEGFTKKGLNCTQYGAVDVEGGCKCPKFSYFMGTCTPVEEIGCQHRLRGSFKNGELFSMHSDDDGSLGSFKKIKSGRGNGIFFGYEDNDGECNKLGDISLWNTGASGISGDWVSIKSEQGKLWDYKRGYLAEVMGDDMEGKMIKVVPASGCVNLTCTLVVFSGNVSYPVNIQKLQIKETSAPITSAPITSPTTEKNTCGQFTPRYEYILTFLVLALAVIMRG